MFTPCLQSVCFVHSAFFKLFVLHSLFTFHFSSVLPFHPDIIHRDSFFTFEGSLNFVSVTFGGTFCAAVASVGAVRPYFSLHLTPICCPHSRPCQTLTTINGERKCLQVLRPPATSFFPPSRLFILGPPPFPFFMGDSFLGAAA